MHRATLQKKERLSYFREIEYLLKNGDSFFYYPFKIRYVQICEQNTQLETIIDSNKIIVSVPKRNFKRAVKRNLIKRRIREAYRLNKEGFNFSPGKFANIMFIYVGKDIEEYSKIEKNIIEIGAKLKKLIDQEQLSISSEQ